MLDPKPTLDGSQFVSKATLVICLLSLSLVEIGSSQAKEAVAATKIERTIVALELKSDADSMAAAGLLSLDKHPGQSLPLIVRAAATAPDRADLVWLQVGVCQRVSACDPEPMERQLRELAPSNGAGWIGALARAHASKDDEATDAALDAIGHSGRVDIYWTSLIARLSRAAARTGKISLEDASTTIIGYLAAEAIPAYSAASLACKGDRLLRAEIVESCRGVAASLQRGDNLLTEAIGTSIAKRVWPEDSPEWKAAAEARRVIDYRSKYIMKLNFQGEKPIEEYIALCEKFHREQDVFLAQMIAAGENPNPPANWSPR
jgi:hypothetical protein